MKIGITGMLGYIGARLTQKLLESKHEVVGVDNFHKNQIDEIPGTTLHKVDIRDYDNLKKAFEGVDVIIHLAAITGVDPCNKAPDESYEVNVIGTENVARVAAEHKVGLVFAASFALFGNPEKFPIQETDTFDPINWYGQLKYMGMKNVEMISQFKKIPAITLIKSNIYGVYKVGDKTIIKPTVVNLFFENALNKKDMPIFEPGDQARNFIYIDDVVDGYIKAAERVHRKKGGFELFNVAAKKDLTVRAIAEAINRIFKKHKGYEVKIDIITNPRLDEVTSTKFDVDISKSQRELGFEPKYDIESALEEMIKFF